ncbi:hypothetical protein ACFLTJ_02285 [Chloroflexota bacterium]
MTEEIKEQKKQRQAFGMFIPAGLFIGRGVGWLLGALVPGLFIGLGAGFLGGTIHHYRKRK